MRTQRPGSPRCSADTCQFLTYTKESYIANKRIGILTGGGDVPGLNLVIKSVVYRGAEIGCDVIGIRRGWEGLTHVDLNDPGKKDAIHPARLN
jgi:phosphofructokinase